MSLSEGSLFGEFRVVRRLGKSGMGDVWLLRALTGEEVAAKILDEESSSDHDARKRFLREAELAMGDIGRQSSWVRVRSGLNSRRYMDRVKG